MRGIDLLGEVGDRDRGDTADEQAFEEPPGEQQLIGGCERYEQPDDGRDGDRERYRPHSTDAIGDGGPGDHADGQADGGGRDRQRRGRRADVQIGRDQREHGLGRVELGEGRHTRAEQRGQ